jgi:hypothetical protein
MKCKLPKIGDLGQVRPTKEVATEQEVNLHSKIISIGMVEQVTQAMIKEHIDIPSKDNNLFNYFLVTLKNDMETLSHDATMYEVTLEGLLCRIVIRIVAYHDVWIAYFKEKAKAHA